MYIPVISRILKRVKLKRYIVAGSVALVLFIFLLFSNHGIVNRVRLENQKSDIKKSISEQRRIKDSLENKINQLKNDTLEIERIAREKYGMIKKGEKVYFLGKKGKEK